MPGKTDIKAGSAFVELTLKNNAFLKGLKSSGDSLKSFGEGAAKMGAGIMAAGALIRGSLLGALNHFATVGSELNDMSIRTGVAGAALAELGYAAEQSGADLGAVESGIRKMQKFMGSGIAASEETIKTLGDLKLSFTQLRAMKPEDQFQTVADALAHIQDPSKRAALAMKVFGKTGTSLMPMLMELSSLRKEFREWQIGPDSAQIKLADEAGDSLSRMHKVLSLLVFQTGAALAPQIIEWSKSFVRVTVAAAKWVKENKGVITTAFAVGGALLVAGAALSAFGLTVAGVGMGLSGLASGFGVIASVLAAVFSPLGLIVSALVLGAVAWFKFSESGQKAMGALQGIFGQLSSVFKTTFGGIIDAIKSGELELAAQIAIAGMKAALLTGIAAISEAIGGPWGDFVASLGTKISEGDFSGAWGIAIEGMGTLWDSFCSGVMSAMTKLANFIVEKWRGAVKSIGDFLLNAGGPGSYFEQDFKNLRANLGIIDTYDEAERAEVNRKKQLAEVEKILANAEAQREAVEAAGGSVTDEMGNTVTTADMDRTIADYKNRRQGLLEGDNNSPLSTDIEVNATADSIHSALDAAQKERERKAAESKAKLGANPEVAGGSNAAQDAADAANAELERLRDKARHAAEIAAAADAAKVDQAAKTDVPKESATKEIFGSFSAAALSAQGGNASPTVRAIEKGNNHLAAIREQNRELSRNLTHGGGIGA